MRIATSTAVVLVLLLAGRAGGQGPADVHRAPARQLRAASPAQRVKAAVALASCGNPRQAGKELLAAALTERHPLVRLFVCRALADFRKPEVALLVRGLGDARPEVRAAAAEALGWIGGASAIAKLPGALKDPDADVRAAAAEALGWIGDRRPAKALVEVLKDGSPAVRREAAVALGRLCEAGTSQPLARLTQDPTAAVRDSAAWAAGRIRDRSSDRPNQRAGKALKQVLPVLALNGISLDDALQFLRDAANVNMYVDWGRMGVDRRTPITLKAAEVPVAKALSAVLAAADPKGRLTWEATEEGVLVCSARQGLHRLTPLDLTGPTDASDAAVPAAVTKVLIAILPKVEFSRIGLSDCLQFTRDVSNLNLHVAWGALAAAGVTRQTPVTLNLRGIPVRRFLEQVLTDAAAPGRLGYVHDGNVLIVSTAADLRLRSHPRVRRLLTIPADRPTRAKLGKPLPRVTFRGVGLGDLLQFLSDVTKVPIRANWGDLRTLGVDRTTPFIVDARNVSAEQVLRLILADLAPAGRLVCTFEGGKVTVAAPDDARIGR